MARRARSRRSYVRELLVIAVTVLALWFWIVNGGPRAFGGWFAFLFDSQTPTRSGGLCGAPYWNEDNEYMGTYPPC